MNLLKPRSEYFDFIFYFNFAIMKKQFFVNFSLVFFIFYFQAFSQADRSKIVLKDKSEIKNVRIWSVLQNKVEYEEGASLHDMATEKIARIETDTAVLSFDEGGNLFSRPYDWLIKNNDDTITCIISQLGGNYVYYYQKGKENRSYVPESSVKKYQVYKPEPVKRNKTGEQPEIHKEPADTISEKINPPENTPKELPRVAETPPEPEIKNSPVPLPAQKEPEITKEETGPVFPVSNDICYESYLKGEQDAEKRPETIWGVGGFCLSGCCSSVSIPALTLMALTNREPVRKFPEGVDEKCYSLGYQNQLSKKRVSNTSIGGLISTVIIGAFAYFIILNQGQM